MAAIASAPASRTTFGRRPRPARRITVVTKQSISVIAEAVEDEDAQYATIRADQAAISRLTNPRSFSNPAVSKAAPATAGFLDRDSLFELKVAGALEKRLATSSRKGNEAVGLGQGRDANELVKLAALSNFRQKKAHARAQSTAFDTSASPMAQTPFNWNSPRTAMENVSLATPPSSAPAFRRSHRRVASEASSMPTAALPSLSQIREYVAKQKAKEEAEKVKEEQEGDGEKRDSEEKEGVPVPVVSEPPKAPRESRLPAFLKRQSWTPGMTVTLPPSPTSSTTPINASMRQQLGAQMLNKLGPRLVVA